MRFKSPRKTVTNAVYNINGGPHLSAAISAEMSKLADEGLVHSAYRFARSEEDIKALFLLPPDFKVLRRFSGEYGDTVMANSKLWDTTVLLESQAGEINVYAASRDYGDAAAIAQCIVGRIPPAPEIEETDVRVNVWMLGPSGPTYRAKTITVPRYDDVEDNYPGYVGDALSRIMSDESPTDSGKIILWHGEPGTGKTSAIRALMREWKDWCSFHYVSDPEQMFNHPGYLLEVGTGDGRFRLVICEDTGQFLKIDASETSGAAMGRLLNFSDGILGQGSNTLFLLTTNEDISLLHPALVRPGRCLQRLKFQRFTPEQANKWLADDEAEAFYEHYTLAELIAFKKDRSSSLQSIGV